MTASLLSASEGSRFYQHWLQADRQTREPQIEKYWQQRLETADFAHLLQSEVQTGLPLTRAMRRVRNLVIATLIQRDLTGLADLDEVISTMTAFAEFAIKTHLQILTTELTERHGTPTGHSSGKAQQLIVIGMGKLGGRELNVSSDVDLIFVYPENGDTLTTTPGQRSLSNQEFFTRLGQRLIQALSEIIEDGFTFRVDMALRPNGASGPLVCSFGHLEQYLITQGREWERYAWIKARAITGDPADIEQLEKIVQPFVFRRYLDFGVIEAIRDMHEQIRSEVTRQERLHPERNLNVKLGRGGIREIEFLAQMFQLIRGGRDPELRDRSTRHILKLLVQKRQLDAPVAAQLLEAYTFLRNLEHRIQYLDDAQTHILPAHEADRERIAKMAGFENAAALLDKLRNYRDFVSAQFDDIFHDPAQEEPKTSLAQPLLDHLPEAEQLEAIMRKMEDLGFTDADQGAQQLLSFWKTNRVQSMQDNSRNRLVALIDQTLPGIVRESRNPLLTLRRLLNFMEAIARRSAYLSLLIEYPTALNRLIRMMSASDWASHYLTWHPILLDELLDVRTLLAPPDWDSFESELHQQMLQHRGDTERQMDLLREAHHAQLFRLLAQDLEGVLTVERLADHLSKLADIILDTALQEIWLNLPKRHQDIPRFAIIAYGKLGGKELGYASDLDLIFLYQDDHPEAPMLYTRLAQRLMTWMSTPTAAGTLFEIDIALRPDGASGLVVTPFSSFARYQEEAAWAWEHQALTRARFCAGDLQIGEAFETLRTRILCQHRDPEWLKKEVFSIRQKMHDAHPNRSGMFDLKHDTGGMIDIEFIVQYLVLIHAHQYPELTGNIGNIALLILCEKLGLIPPDMGARTASIYREFRRQQHQLRMQGAPVARVDFVEVTEETATVKKLWQRVFGIADQ